MQIEFLKTHFYYSFPQRVPTIFLKGLILSRDMQTHPHPLLSGA
jgi:hypothetical protein